MHFLGFWREAAAAALCFGVSWKITGETPPPSPEKSDEQSAKSSRLTDANREHVPTEEFLLARALRYLVCSLSLYLRINGENKNFTDVMIQFQILKYDKENDEHWYIVGKLQY